MAKVRAELQAKATQSAKKKLKARVDCAGEIRLFFQVVVRIMTLGRPRSS